MRLTYPVVNLDMYVLFLWVTFPRYLVAIKDLVMFNCLWSSLWLWLSRSLWKKKKKSGIIKLSNKLIIDSKLVTYRFIVKVLQSPHTKEINRKQGFWCPSIKLLNKSSKEQPFQSQLTPQEISYIEETVTIKLYS